MQFHVGFFTRMNWNADQRDQTLACRQRKLACSECKSVCRLQRPISKSYEMETEKVIDITVAIFTFFDFSPTRI